MKSGDRERLWGLQTSANSLVLEGKRDPKELLDFLQAFVFGNALRDIDWLKVYQSLRMEAEYVAATAELQNWSDPSLWIVPVVKGVTPNKVVAGIKESGVKVWTVYNDLDKEVSGNERDPANGSYLRGFRRTIEADEENKDLSANAFASLEKKGGTLTEQLLLEHGYHLTTGEHLDVVNATLCTGSRYRDGSVPSVDFNPDSDGVYVNGYDPDGHNDGLRPRSAVPPPVAEQLA
jgi:hypothetical protein